MKENMQNVIVIGIDWFYIWPKPILFMKSFLLSTLLFVFSSSTLFSQCELGEIALTMNIAVDAWGQETYWELVPSGNNCGDGTIAFGSNSGVGCAGTDPTDDGGYVDNTIVSEGPFCLVEGQFYDLIFVDSYGDGGLVFELFEDNSFSHTYIGGGDGNTWTFEAGNSGLPANDSPCGATEIFPDGEALLISNEGAVTQLSEPHPAAGGCGTLGFWCEGNITNTVWAYFIAQENVSYDITTCNEIEGFDTQLALYHASSCSDYLTFELISSNDDMQGGCSISNGFSSRMFASCLVPGDAYYIQMDGWQGAIGTALLSVSTYIGEIEMFSSVNNINCPLDKSETPNGAITPYVVGSGVDFTASWTGPNNFTSDANYLSDLGPGTYNLTLTTACGDVFTDEYQISQPSSWNIAGTGVGPDCAASENGSITLTVTGATAPYTYAWSGPDNFMSPAEDISNLNFGSYQVTITDERDCQIVQTYQLNPINNLTFDLGNDTTICLTDNVIVSGPAGLNYTWQDGSINQFYVIDAEEWDLGPHALILTASTDDGCSYSDAFLFTVETCASVNESDKNILTVYPNPASSLLNLNFNQTVEHALIQLIDASGRVVATQVFRGASNCVLDLNVASGVYALDITMGEEHVVRQIVVE
jgi:hypothetical protein